MARVVIIGAGFAGHTAALYLGDKIGKQHIDQHAVHPGGRQPHLAPALQVELEQAIAGPAPDGGLWTGPKVAAWMAERLGRPIYKQLGWVYL